MRHSLRAVSLWWLIVLVPITGAAATNKAPKAKKDAAITVAGRSVPIKVWTNDRDPEGGIRGIDRKTVDIVRRPRNGKAKVKRRNGKVIYTPDPGFSGQDTFKYRVKDNRGAWSNKARVTVTVADSAVVITSLQEDSGTNKSDFITNDDEPTLIGTATTDMIEVTLYENDTPILPAAPVNTNGTWFYDLVLDEGDYNFTATGTNAFGQESSPSAAKIVTVDTTDPSPPSTVQAGCGGWNDVFVSSSQLDKLPVFVPISCLSFGSQDLLVRAEVQQVDSNDDLIGPIHTYPISSDDELEIEIEITEKLGVGRYHLKLFVSDVAGNESCLETFASAPENPEDPVCAVNSVEGQGFLEVLELE